jgi:DNA-binding IscR family transcriptional regulator
VVAVGLVLELARAQEEGEGPLALPELSRRLRSSPGEVEGVVEALEARGILARTEEGLLLAASPRRIPLREIVSPVAGALPEAPPEPEALRRAYSLFKEREKFLEKTLAEV